MAKRALLLSAALTHLVHSYPNAQITRTVIPIPATASPYPSQPTVNEFSYENFDENSSADKDHRTKVHSAFVDWADLMQAAVQSLADTSDDTFDRWFPPTVKRGQNGKSIDARGYVRSVFLQVFKPDANSPAPQSRVQNMVDRNDDFKNACKPNVKAYTWPPTGEFHVCDRGFTSQAIAATDLKCEDLGTQVSGKMNSLTGTLAHEFMHWDRVGKDVQNSAGKIVDVAYGPGTCMRLRGGSDKQDTFVNADSYKWFALNAYYDSKCNKKFGDPLITTEDFEESLAELEESPLYDSELASGSLAGV